MPPRPGVIGEAVQAEHERAGALFEGMEGHVRGLNGALCHGVPSISPAVPRERSAKNQLRIRGGGLRSAKAQCNRPRHLDGPLSKPELRDPGKVACNATSQKARNRLP